MDIRIHSKPGGDDRGTSLAGVNRRSLTLLLQRHWGCSIETKVTWKNTNKKSVTNQDVLNVSADGTQRIFYHVKRIFLLLQCSFLPKFSIHIETKYEDNKGSNDSIFDNEAKDLEREVCFIDIASDEIPERYYKESEDPKYFKSQKTGRGQLKEGWRETHQPIMCSYKLVTVKFEVWGLQTRVEQFVHKVVRDILLIGHRQAFAWVDEWYDMTMDDVREYEKNMHEKTNIKVCNQHSSTVDEIESHAKARFGFRKTAVFVTEQNAMKISRTGSNLSQRQVDMTMDEVREFERATQEATNKKIGIFPPEISISNISMPSSTRSAPSSAPSTPLSTDAPDFLTVPKDRPRKKSAPETLTLPDLEKKKN
ncbi:hypothetical protein ASZ78_006571 [Callipepla squamata]|uniref:Phosphatidylinositol transfer protein N-terminal domain-containing protein n=1 Tax=Callipepla squamata TaxID=9009 RepID=A0A226NB42_CALSU|nr:hypothetical protein ASZ78_006571 [Callipepla squamata]